jgi:Uma2 family endonuclease
LIIYHFKLNKMTATLSLRLTPQITWEKLPTDYILPDDPVENILQPLLASALTEALDIANLLTPMTLVATNMGICAKIDQRTVVKAPDWFYVPTVYPLPQGEIRRSYTPNLEGNIPLIIMEFLSETDGGEYSVRPTYPYGKLWFYEKIVTVPYYVIFDPSLPLLEVRYLQSKGYELLMPNSEGKYLIKPLGLNLGIWQGTRQNITAYWLRWWDNSGNLLLWGSETIEQKQQQLEQEKLKIQRLAKRLQELGIELEEE